MSHTVQQQQQIREIRAALSTAGQRLTELGRLETLFREHQATLQLSAEKTQALLEKFRTIQGTFSPTLGSGEGSEVVLQKFAQAYREIEQLMGAAEGQTLMKKFGEMLEAKRKRQALEAQTLRLRTAVELRRQQVEKKEALLGQAQANSVRYQSAVTVLQSASSNGSTPV